ncbi:hypothetical protein FS749_007283 [Ceratobasidium sp. UAMH 11750]|nr:hypothetical protein FS749_007283 [Ceratobasidium sp. UAMH 11750]
MLITRFFAVALAFIPAVQVFAAPAPMNGDLSIRELPSRPVNSPMSLEDILARARANIGTIKSGLNSGDPQSAETATVKLKTTFDNLMGDLKSLKKAKTNEQNVRLEENGIFDPRSWPILGQVYELVKAGCDILTLVDQIRAAAAAQSTGDKLNGVMEILKTIVKAAPTVVSIILSILPYF